MRTFEIILLLSVTVLPFIKRPLLKRINSNYVIIVLAIVAGLHFIIEGWRWQMIPAYLLLPILAWRIKAVNISKPAKISFLRILGFTGIVILAFFGWVLSSLLPVFTLPEPQGAFNVGTESRYVETTLDEVITKDPSDKRELMYKIWYPSNADISGLASDRYVDPAGRAGFATKYGLPATALNYLDRVNTHVYPGIPIADGSFPVLIFSHGYGSKATGYYAMLTELASQGYIIINMNHTYESLGVTFPDGDQRYFDYDFQREISANAMENITPLRAAFKDGLSYEERHPIVSDAVRNFYESESMNRWAKDMIYTIDLLETWNDTGSLTGKMNLEQLGVFGHSNGGGSAGKVPLMDDRVKAAANIDGITWGNLIDTTYQIPFLYISADWPADHEDINSHVYINKSTNYFYETKLLKSGHPNFMDIPFMIPVPALAGTGEIDPYLGIEVVNRLTTAFFDKHLKNSKEIDLGMIGEEYQSLEITIHPGDSIRQMAIR